jgi:hypothetical protein
VAKPGTVERSRKVRPDSKGRITLGRLAEGVSSYRVRSAPDGKITLEPFVEVPARERWLYESPDSLARVRRGLAESKEGRTESLGSFSRYAK